MAARIQILPADAKPGDLLEIRLIIGHPMESGLRRDDVGARIQRNIVNKITCKYNGAEVFKAELGPGMAANPYLTFHTRATKSGELQFDWVDDNGERGSERAVVTLKT
jgi:sulfur-oxidizing protein SoxZ